MASAAATPVPQIALESLTVDHIGTHQVWVGHISQLTRKGKMTFGKLRQGLHAVNFVYRGSDLAEASVGAAVELTGTLVAAPAKATQLFEIQVDQAVVVSGIRDPATYLYGADVMKSHGPEHNLKILKDVRDRSDKFALPVVAALMGVRSRLKFVLQRFFVERGFLLFDAPILTSSDCEGAGEMFEASSGDFFSSPAFLTVSGQLEGEAGAKHLERVCVFGPCFRAERSSSSRHLSEFLMIEPELRFTDPDERQRFEQLMDLEEDMVKYSIKAVLEESPKELDYLQATVCPDLKTRLQTILEAPFKRISYTEVIGKLQAAVESKEAEFDVCDIHFGMDLAAEHESYVCNVLHGGVPTFIHDYPAALKSFYMKKNPDGLTCQAVDLIAPYGVAELCGGSMREDDPEKLLGVVKERGMDPETLKDYIGLRQDGYFPTGGFGCGFDRLLRLLTGVESVRDVVPFPRYHGKL